MANKDAFYEAILSAGADMQKTASEHDIIAALEGTDLSDEELDKLASELEAALNDFDETDADDVDEVDEDVETDDVDEVDNEDADDADKSASEEDEDETETEDLEEVESDDESDEDLEEEELDIESLAAAYEAEYEKYASEGLTVKDYIFNQVEDEEFAAVVGDMAEKLAFVSELPVFMVADDLMNTISEKISAGEEQNG